MKGTIVKILHRGKHRGGMNLVDWRWKDGWRGKRETKEAKLHARFLEGTGGGGSFQTLLPKFEGAQEGMTIGREAQRELKSCLGSLIQLKDCESGMTRYNVEREAGGGGSVGRASGSQVVVLEGKSGRDPRKAKVKLPSGRIGFRDGACSGRIGQSGNSVRNQRSLGKAGKTR